MTNKPCILQDSWEQTALEGQTTPFQNLA